MLLEQLLIFSLILLMLAHAIVEQQCSQYQLFVNQYILF